MGHILVEHDSVEHFAVFDGSAWEFFDFCVPLDVDFKTGANFPDDGLDSFDGEVDDEVAPFEGKLCADAGSDDFSDVFFFLDIDWDSELFCDLHDIVKSFEVSLDNLGRMDIFLNERLSSAKDFSCEDDD